jgi:hypothetical protein
MKKHLLAALAALTLAAPVAAQAQVAPSYAQGPSTATTEEDVHGRVVGFDGAYNLTVRDERGFIDNVQLHDGTIINPTGLTLAPGMIVNILGYDAGDYLAANEIDTPYTFENGDPCYDGHLWSYWGPSVDLAFFFGNVGWWHGGYFGGPFAWNGGVRIYHDVSYRTVYRVNERPIAYRRPVPVNDSLEARGNRVHENPIPLGNNAHPDYSHESPAANANRNAYEPANRNNYAPANRNSYAPTNRGNYAPASRSNQPANRGNYQPANRGSEHPASAPARESRPSEGHERR